jgi:hypothetical protein
MSLRDILILITLADFLFCSCKKKEQPEPEPVENCSCSYSGHIRPLVISRCAVSGCHVDNFPFGNFTRYGDLKARVDNGKVNRLVLEEKLMPPAGKPQLTEEELQKLRNWIANGAPED